MNVTSNPDFSIVIATYNAESSLQSCLDSIAIQTWPSSELVVVDAASEDGTVEILRHNSSIITKWTSEPDSGIYDAWNKAISLASGTWIYFIGADDAFADQNVLEKVSKFLGQNWQGELITYGHVDGVDEIGRVYENLGTDWDVAKRSLDFEMSIPHQGMFHHRDLFERYGKFDESFKIAADYDLLLRATAKEIPLYLGSLTIARKTRGGVSMDVSKSWQTSKEARRAQKINNCFTGKARQKFLLNMTRALIFQIFGPRVTEWLVDLYRVRILHRPPRFE